MEGVGVKWSQALLRLFAFWQVKFHECENDAYDAWSSFLYRIDIYMCVCVYIYIYIYRILRCFKIWYLCPHIGCKWVTHVAVSTHIARWLSLLSARVTRRIRQLSTHSLINLHFPASLILPITSLILTFFLFHICIIWCICYCGTRRMLEWQTQKQWQCGGTTYRG